MLHQRSRFIERSARTLAKRGGRHLCALADQLRNILPHDLPVVDKAARVKAASQDANWFSPPLRAELKEKSAECGLRVWSAAPRDVTMACSPSVATTAPRVTKS